MPRQKIKEFYTPEEITPEMLVGMVDETELRPKRILDFVDLIEHDSEKIERDIFVQQSDQFASIVGFSDSPIRTEGMIAERKSISPFHMKNYTEFDETNSKLMDVSGDSVAISSAGLAASTKSLESKRKNLQHWAVLAMINDREFSYQDDDLSITIPYTDEVGVLTAPGTKLDTLGAATAETDLMKTEYYRLNRQIPTLAFMSAATAAKFKAIADVKASFVPLQSSDPDLTASMFEGFLWNGIQWVILHEQYPILDGTLKDAIDSGRIIMTVENVDDPNPEASGSPFKLHRASNNLNRNDTSGPRYSMFKVSEKPIKWGHDMYDNMIPGTAKRNAVMHWEAISP